jgi:Kef-type K+ transport system membrane component KefB
MALRSVALPDHEPRDDPMIDLAAFANDLAWPVAILVAWLAGEHGHRWAGLPRISVYAFVGFALSSSQAGLLPPTTDTMLLFANIAFGIFLFESGHRINLHWLRANPWIGVTSLAEAALTFASVLAVARWFDVPMTSALLMATLAMATSPATVVRVVSEQRSSGQVTERALHLSVLDCVLAVFAFKVVVGLAVFETSGSVLQAAYTSLVDLATSVALGGLFGAALPGVLKAIRRTSPDSTLAFAIAVVVLVALTHRLNLSPVSAALTFGLVARHRRVVLGPAQRGFGTLGEILSVFLFTFVASTMNWQSAIEGCALGLAIIGARCIAKVAGIGLFAHASAITWRKGLLVGMAMMPISAFVILVLEQTRHLGVDLVDRLAPLAAAALILEILGPILTQRALAWSHEAGDGREK